MMGIARELKSSAQTTTQFLLAHQEKDPNTSTQVLESTLKQLPLPFDLWLVNFHAPVAAEAKKCVVQTKSLPLVDGYEYKLYQCR
jgi:uncharacterized membrane protein